MSSRPDLKQTPSAFVAGLVVGGFVWIVFDSLVFGFLAAIATGFLINRDREPEEEDHS